MRFTTPLRELPPSSVATLENWISGGTVAFVAAVTLCCAALNRLHSKTSGVKASTIANLFHRIPPRFLGRPCAYTGRPWIQLRGHLPTALT